jgi:hypothetical protein
MRRIEIFVSCRKDTRKERAVAERLIRSVAAEFAIPVSASYSNWLRAPCKEERVAAQGENRGRQQEGFLLCPCFREYQDRNLGDDYQEHTANAGQFDLVICLLWSQLGTKVGPTFLMPDGSEPKSATQYEIAWALDQRRRTPEFPALQVYRNRSTLAAPLEPRKEREGLFEEWDLVQECFAEWEKDSAFAEVSSEYSDLGEFEALFRNRFRAFVAARLRDEFPQRKSPQRTYHWDANPFRGLDFFDLEHTRFFHGRTKTAGRALDVLQQQAAAKRPFLLVWGPGGCGKTSLVRAGLLPILTQVGTTEGDGPWRFACTRPGGGGKGDAFDALAAAFLEESALPELPDAVVRDGWRNLAAVLRENPEGAVLRLQQTLDHISTQALDPFLEQQRTASRPADAEVGFEFDQQSRLGRFRPKAQLALVVDQLEELFVAGFSAELQQKYLTTLSALVRCQRIFVIATLRSEFYASFQKACSSDDLAVLSGRFELYPPRAPEIADMIRLPAEAAGLRFERESETGQSLDRALVEDVAISPKSLPLLEHALSELYRMQLVRNDGVLRWSDYRELGELEVALAAHAENALLALDGDAQAALQPVIRKLASPGRSDQGAWICRPVPYRNLVWSPQLDTSQIAGARRLIYRFIQEGLFHAGTCPSKELLVSVTQESLLQNWPRVRQFLKEEVELLRIRSRLEVNLQRWLSKGRRSNELLRSESGLSEAETLVRRFRTSLSDVQLDYLRKSLKAQRRRRWLRSGKLASVIGGLAALLTVSTLKSLNLETKRKKAETALSLERRIANSAQQNEVRAESAKRDAERAAASQLDALQTRLKETEANAEQAEKKAELAAGQRDVLEAKLESAEAKAQEAQKNAELAVSQLEGLQAQLKDSEAKAQKAQEYAAELAASQRDVGQARLNDTDVNAQQTRKDNDPATGQRDAPPHQNAEPKLLPEVENNSQITTGQSSAEATTQIVFKSEPTQKDESMVGDPRPVDLTRMDQSKAAAPQPTPAPAASVAPPAAEVQADESTGDPAGEVAVKQFVLEYLQTVSSDDVSTQERFFAPRVNFYGKGILSLRRAQASTERYHREWPVRDWEPRGEAQILQTANPRRYEVLQPFSWRVSNGSQYEEGRATLYVRIWKNAKGQLHIVHIDQRER